MTAFSYAAAEEANWKRNLEAMTSYRPKTTFFSDFSIAEFCGRENAVRETYSRVLNSWIRDIEYMTELCMVLNHKIWEWHNRNDNVMTHCYNDLWNHCSQFIEEHFTGDDLQYYYEVTD